MKITFVRGPIYTSIKFTDTSYSTIAEYLGAVRRATSAQPEGYKFSPSYKKKTWDGFIRLYKNNRFPTGLLNDVIKEIKKQGPISIEIDNSQYLMPLNPDQMMIDADMLRGITLRPYQVAAAGTLMSYGRGIAKMATNSGKTEVIAAMCKVIPGKIVILTTKRELMYQTSERISNRTGEEVGYIGDGQRNPKRITVAMIQTLVKNDHLAREFADVCCVMFDECFPEGTLVDGRPIEDIRVGDSVTAFDGRTGSISEKTVTRTFKRPMPGFMIMVNTETDSLVCTMNHMFYTMRGWVASCELRSTDYVLRRSTQSSVRTYAQVQSGAYGRESQTHGGKQSVLTCRYEDENKQHVEKHGPQTTSAWWKWYGIAEAASFVVGRIRRWLADRVLCVMRRWQQKETSPNQLQIGYSQSTIDGSCGSGWDITCNNIHSNCRQEEGGILEWIRVVGIKSVERGYTDGFEELCPGDSVYNLEVADWHTYTANGYIVHNCHHVSSVTAQNVMLELPAPLRFGFSGTPLHNDKLEDMILIGATGPILVDISNADLIESGVSAMPYVDMYVVESDRGFKNDWSSAYSKFIVNNEKRNNIIARVVKESDAGATLIIVDRLEHGRKLKELIPGSLFAHGSLSTDERKSILDLLRKGEKAVVIATPIFDEGVDVPSVELLVLAAGGEAHIRLMQRIGRGMRRKESNVLHVVDFVDDTNKHLLSHSQRRAELYEAENFFVRIVEEDH